MKKITITLMLIAASTLLLTACTGSETRGKLDTSGLTIDSDIVADCDGIKADITAKEANVYSLKNLQNSYCPIMVGGLDDIMIWLTNLKKTPEKVCPNLYAFETNTDCSGSSCNLGALDEILYNSMASLIGTLNPNTAIVAGVFTNFKCSPAILEGAKELFIRIFPKYLLKKTSLFCPDAREDTIRDAVTGAFDLDIKTSQLPGYTTNVAGCVTSTNSIN
ncbi:MAG: hypothetical protein NTY22_05870 [Proteobacteria bacterium]|nr:hypothetical protein [Pseudomonadota bacterium]